MGSNNSKSNNETAAQTQKNDLEKDIGGNPDPRSPTPEITRTPLQNKNGAKHNITKNVDLRKTFENGKTEEKLIHNNPILSAVIKNHLQSYDPRSPTQDFERTPIVLSSNITDGKRHQLRELIDNHCDSPCLKNETLEMNDTNKSLDINEISPELILPKNLCNGFYDLTLNESLTETDEPLGSSTASNDAIEQNTQKELHMKPTTLLETNFDYIQDKEEKLEQNNNDDSSLLSEDIKPEFIKNIPLYKILNEDPRSPSIDIDRTPIIVLKVDGNESEENVEQMSDDSLIKALQNTNTELRQNAGDRKDGILIYEDESMTFNATPKKSKSANNGGSRTPLSCMKNKTDVAHARSKSASTKDTKDTMTKKVSHIPRLKSLNKQAKIFQTGSTVSLKNIGKTGAIGGDCENTPPHTHRDRWDKESSIVL